MSTSLAPLLDELTRQLAATGYYRSSVALTFEQFSDCMAELGAVKKPTEIRPQGPNPILESGRPLSPHNDCNYYADYVAWYCRDDGGAGDRTFIVDVTPLYEQLSTRELDALAKVQVRLLNHEGGGCSVIRWLDDRPQLFYVPWSLFHDGDAFVDATVRKFHRLLKQRASTERIRGGPIALRTGHFLIIDDHRFMHGRDAVPDEAPRHLFRVYVKRQTISAAVAI